MSIIFVQNQCATQPSSSSFRTVSYTIFWQYQSVSCLLLFFFLLVVQSSHCPKNGGQGEVPKPAAQEQRRAKKKCATQFDDVRRSPPVSDDALGARRVPSQAQACGQNSDTDTKATTTDSDNFNDASPRSMLSNRMQISFISFKTQSKKKSKYIYI